MSAKIYTSNIENEMAKLLRETWSLQIHLILRLITLTAIYNVQSTDIQLAGPGNIIKRFYVLQIKG